MTSLLLPDGLRPANLHLRDDPDDPLKVRFVTSDMYDICNRIAGISDRLFLLELEKGSAEAQRFGYAVVERCTDGVDRVVFRVGKDGLDARVLERLRYLMSVPLAERMRIIEVERDSWEARHAEEAAEELYETLGGPMYRQLHHDGFAHGRRESYRPLNRTARRHGRRMT